MLMRWLRSLLGLDDTDALIAGLRADLEAHGKAHSGVMVELAQALNNTSTFARDSRRILDEYTYRMSVYESNIPAMAKIKKAQDEKARRRQKLAAAEATLAASPEGAESAAEMAVIEDAIEADATPETGAA